MCQSGGILIGGFVPCIQMDADAYEHPPEGEMIPAPYFQVLQAVIVKDAVVDTFAGSPFLIDLPVLFRVLRDAGLEA